MIATSKRLNIAGFQHPNSMLKAISFSHVNKHNQAMWDCICECGTQLKEPCWIVHNGHVKSCGCIRRKGKTYLYCGEEKTVREWALDSQCKVSFVVFRNRLRLGWGIEAALKTPLTKKYKPRTAPEKVTPSGRGIPLKELLNLDGKKHHA